MYEYEIPAVNGRPIIDIPKELKYKIKSWRSSGDKIIITSDDLIDELLYYTDVVVRDLTTGNVIKSLAGDYLVPPVASAVVCKDSSYVYALRPASNWKGYVIIDKGEAGVDDAKVIQSAIDSVEQNGGGRILITDIFIINKTLEIGSGTNLEGLNRRKTGFKLSDGVNCDILRNKNFDKGYEVTHVDINNLLFDGNKNNNTKGNGINIQMYASKIRNCEIFNCAEAGIRVDSSTGEDNEIYGNHIHHCGSYGILHLYGASSIRNNIIFHCGNFAIRSSGYNKDIRGNYTYGNAGGIYSENAMHMIITNNRINDPVGIIVRPTRVVGDYPDLYIIANNYIYGDLNAGIWLYGVYDSSTGNEYKVNETLIIGNIITYTGSTNKSGWAEGFIVLIRADNNIIAFNKFRIRGTGTLVPVYIATDSCFGNKFIENEGYVTENSGSTSLTGDGTSTTLSTTVAHGLVSDKFVARATVYDDNVTSVVCIPVDTDNDGFKESIKIVATFSTAPANGATIPVYWEAEVVS